MAKKSRSENAAENEGLPARLVSITASYHDYTPPFAVEPIVRRMLDSIPKRYLTGLSEIVLTNSSGLTRARRRSVTTSRKRKVRQATSLGLYHPAWNSNPAWIEIFIDNTVRGWDRGLWLKLPWMRESKIGDVLFHEIGHHIHFTARPKYKEREDVADTWKAVLERNYHRKRHPWLRAITSPLRPLIRALMRPMHRKMLQNGMISRAEFEELRNPSKDSL